MLWRCCTVCTLLAPANTHAALLSHCFCPALCGLINGDHVDRETINLHFYVLQQWFHYDRFTSIRQWVFFLQDISSNVADRRNQCYQILFSLIYF